MALPMAVRVQRTLRGPRRSPSHAPDCHEPTVQQSPGRPLPGTRPTALIHQSTTNCVRNWLSEQALAMDWQGLEGLPEQVLPHLPLLLSLLGWVILLWPGASPRCGPPSWPQLAKREPISPAPWRPRLDERPSSSS